MVYHVVEAQSLKELINRVNDLLLSGDETDWVPFGGVSKNGDSYLQVVISQYYYEQHLLKS